MPLPGTLPLTRLVAPLPLSMRNAAGTSVDGGGDAGSVPVWEDLTHFDRKLVGELKARRKDGKAVFWMPDEAQPACRNCHRTFSFFVRRHHCRLCGHIFCHDCVDYYVKGELLGENDEELHRVCFFCDGLLGREAFQGRNVINLILQRLDEQDYVIQSAVTEDGMCIHCPVFSPHLHHFFLSDVA